MDYQQTPQMTHNEQMYVNMMVAPMQHVYQSLPNSCSVHPPPQFVASMIHPPIEPGIVVQQQIQMMAPCVYGMANVHPQYQHWTMPLQTAQNTNGHQRSGLQMMQQVGSAGMQRVMLPRTFPNTRSGAVVLAQKVPTFLEQNESMNASATIDHPCLPGNYPSIPNPQVQPDARQRASRGTSSAQAATSTPLAPTAPMGREAAAPTSLPSPVRQCVETERESAFQASIRDAQPALRPASFPASEDAHASVEDVVSVATQELQGTTTMWMDEEPIHHHGEEDAPDGLAMLASCAEALAQQKWRCAKCGKVDTPKRRRKGKLCNACGLKTTESVAQQNRRKDAAYKKEAKQKAAAREALFAYAATVITNGGDNATKDEPHKCQACDATQSIHWRAEGTLCNACGLGGARHLRNQHGNTA